MQPYFLICVRVAGEMGELWFEVWGIVSWCINLSLSFTLFSFSEAGDFKSKPYLWIFMIYFIQM